MEQQKEVEKKSVKSKLLYTVIEMQLANHSHPIRIVSSKLQEVFIQSYLHFVNEREQRGSVLW